jgi:hypothetical protein
MVETVVDVRADHETLVGDGVVGLKGAFSRDFAEAMREDMMTAFWDAIQRPGGGDRARATPLVCRDSPAAVRRFRRALFAPVGRGRVRGDARA